MSLARFSPFFALAFVAGALALPGCADTNDAKPTASGVDPFSSNQATLLDFEFDGSLVTDFSFDDKRTIQSQLLFTIGHLNDDNSVGRLDNLVLSNIVKTTENGQVQIAYHARPAISSVFFSGTILASGVARLAPMNPPTTEAGKLQPMSCRVNWK